MLELPEALTIGNQLSNTVIGKRISAVTAAQSPHKLAWYNGEPQNYHSLLEGRTVGKARGVGGWVEIEVEGAVILFCDGVGIRYHEKGGKHPLKHQLLIEFEDGSAVSGSVQMYGGLLCFREGEVDNPYYEVAKARYSPLSEAFDADYFNRLISPNEVQKLSLKAFLATEQRIPGLGNGVSQDILWKAGMHPKRKINTLSATDKELLLSAIKTVLGQMAKLGGRDTEKDLFGNNGGYRTMMSKNSAGLSCMACGGYIKKESYLGGSVYYCESCQVL